MINGIAPAGKYITISGGNSSGPYISPGAAGAGMMRYNPNTSNIEVNDGNSWQIMSSSYTSVGLTPEAESLLDWARQKRIEEQQMQTMLEQFPALKKAKDNFDLIWNLVKDEQYKDSV